MSKVVIVTGASRGIGKAIAEELLKKDFDVIITARKENDATRQMIKTYGKKVTFIP